MMKKALLLLWALLLTLTGARAQYRNSLEDLNDSETVRALKGHVAMLAGAQMEGRAAGSEGEKMAAEYVAAQLKECGVDLLTYGTQFSLAQNGDTLQSRNVVGFIQGWDKALSNHYIVVGARLDNLGMDTYTQDGETQRRIYYGANGNASGLAMMLELARKLSFARTLVRRSILLVGFGGSQASFAGAWYFLNRGFQDAEKIDALVDLDVLGTGENGLQVFTAANADLNTLVRKLQGELLPIQASLIPQAPYPGDYSVFYNKEIPAALFTTGRYPEYGTARDTYEIVNFPEMERELEYIFSFVQQLCNGPRPLFRDSTVPESDAQPGTVAWADADVKPMFLNSPDPRTFMEKWVYQYLKYPKYAVENGIQGRVLVDFIIDENGNVKDVKVSRSIHTSLDDEAVRVVSASPKWRPGRHRGKKVRIALTVGVDFKLDKNKGKFGINGYGL